ncbi:MAG: hypothetical protein ACFFER_19060, partial [Candidatus Thorarchaeota archaeon]
MYTYFKLFHSIKDEHEIELARLEIESLVGKIDEVRNFADSLVKKPLKSFLNVTQDINTDKHWDPIRFQDFLMHELPYGKVQGFLCKDVDPKAIESLVRRLGYTREIYIISEDLTATR